MAVIGKIRKRSGLLVVVIGVALAAFVLGDFATGGGGRPEMNVGSIDGEDISIQDFNLRYEQNVNAQQQQQGNRLTQDEMFRVRENTWNQMVEEMIMGKEYETLGLTVTPEELFDQIQGSNPHPAVIQNFTNPETGQFDRELVLNYLQNLSQMPQASKDQWLIFERYVKEDRLRTKYQNLITKAHYLPTALAKANYENKNTKAEAELLSVRYSAVPDSLAVPTEADFNKFYEENKKSYDRPAMRDIEFVAFEVKPSKKDNEAAREFVNSLKAEFEVTDNIAGFVNANSDTRYDSSWKGNTEVPVALEQVMFENEPGFVYGPYFDQEAYRLARLVDVNYRPDSVKASHILLAYTGAMRSEQSRTKAAAQQLADSLLAVVKKSPAKLKELAMQFSDDGSVAQNSGDLGWFRDGQMVPQFNQYVIDNEVGSIGMVETDFGYHIIEVTGKKEPQKKVRIAEIVHHVTPSTQTYQDVFAEASRFASATKTRDDFDNNIADQGLNKRLAPNLRTNSNRITGMENPRQVVRWAFDEKTSVNDVSDIFDLDNMYVIAVLTKATEKGISSLDDIREMIEPQVKNIKKGEYLVERMKALNNDWDKIIAELKAEKQVVSDLSFDSRTVTGFGQESKLIGTIFTMEEGETSEPLAGNAAAFIVKLIKLTPAPEIDNFDRIRRDYSVAFSNSVRNNAAFRALEKESDIEDNRLLFY
ncbi:MAG: SurA N-terminal domain-containing protein [Bacteroidales bacterium]|jgi:peptidyl-prolyl cis-trans isomerase D|nr:SurA N-terminal domain-containing protein [Bacteroidales bacterium]